VCEGKGHIREKFRAFFDISYNLAGRSLPNSQSLARSRCIRDFVECNQSTFCLPLRDILRHSYSRFGFGCIGSMAGYSSIMEIESSFYFLVFLGVCVGDAFSLDFG